MSWIVQWKKFFEVQHRSLVELKTNREREKQKITAKGVTLLFQFLVSCWCVCAFILMKSSFYERPHRTYIHVGQRLEQVNVWNSRGIVAERKVKEMHWDRKLLLALNQFVNNEQINNNLLHAEWFDTPPKSTSRGEIDRKWKEKREILIEVQ